MKMLRIIMILLGALLLANCSGDFGQETGIVPSHSGQVSFLFGLQQDDASVVQTRGSKPEQITRMWYAIANERGEIIKPLYQKLEEKKEQDRQTLRDLHTEYSSIDRMVDKQNQFLRTILKYKSCAELNAELVKNLIEKIYVYRGKRVEIIWKWKDEFAKVMGGTGDEK